MSKFRLCQDSCDVFLILFSVLVSLITRISRVIKFKNIRYYQFITNCIPIEIFKLCFSSLVFIDTVIFTRDLS